MEAASSNPVFTLRAREPTQSEQPGSHSKGRHFLKRSIPRAMYGPGTGAESGPSNMTAWRLDTAAQVTLLGAKTSPSWAQGRPGPGLVTEYNQLLRGHFLIRRKWLKSDSLRCSASLGSNG